MKKVYLAGYDVFAADAVRRGAQMKRACAERGFIGLYPLDNEASDPKEIFTGNLELIEQCDILIANLNSFRGAEPDSGTCFEVGYAYAKGKRIYGYLEDCHTMREKLGERDSDGFTVENFDMAVNLMLGCSAVIVQGKLEDCLRLAAQEV